jgi:hypothetical protein
MRSLVAMMCASLLLVFFGYATWLHVKHTADSVDIEASQAATHAAEQARKAQEASSEGEDGQQSVTLAGPLAKLMNRGGDSDVETIEARYKPTASDHVGDSVVGTSNKVLQQTFPVAGTVDLPFEVPAHAYSPQLHGSFRSFLLAGAKPTTAPGDVDFLLLTDQQYFDLMAGHPADAVFSADATHNQEVNANLPPTLNQPVKYHLIFRNVSPKTGRRVVQAEFQMDF